MEKFLPIIITGLGLTLFLILVYVLLISVFFKKVPQSMALIRSGIGDTKVSLHKGIYVLPVFHELQFVDLSLKTIAINLTGKNSLISSENTKVDIRSVFTVRIANETSMVHMAAHKIKAEKTFDQNYIKSVFESRFIEAIKTIARKYSFQELLDSRSKLRYSVIEYIGVDLHGYILEDFSIHYIEKSE